MSTEYLNLTEAADLIGCRFTKKPMYAQLLRHYVVSGNGPKVKKVGKHYFFLRKDIIAWQKPEDGRAGNGKGKYA